MTEIEQRAIRALHGVKVPEQTWHGTRIESLNMHLALQPERKLGLSQESDLWFLVWRYRRQIDDREVVAKADEIVNGAMSLGL